MIRNIHDISVILELVDSFTSSGGIQKKDLYSLLDEKYPYIQWEIRTSELLENSERLDLLKVINDRVHLTQHGSTLRSMSSEGIDLNKKQLAYIAENCVLRNSEFINLGRFLKSFVFDERYNAMIFNTTDYPILSMDGMELLTQLDMIRKEGKVLIMMQEYQDFVDDLSLSQSTNTPTHEITQEQLERVLAEQKEIGRIAEDLTMKYEKERLSREALHEESSRVMQVSATNAGIGYDIKSFKHASPSMKHNLFIEVKARKHALDSFIMSRNEIKVAKKLEDKYVIYFWNQLGHHTPNYPTRIITDPFNTLKIKECDDCLAYMIRLDHCANHI